MPGKLNIRYIFTELIAALLVLLFLYNAITKLKDPSGFVGAMQHNPLLGLYAQLLSWLVPVTEIIIVILLIIPKLRRTGLLASLILMSIFTVYVGYMLMTASTLPCTCGGIIEQMNWQQHLGFNSGLTILTFASLFLYPKRFVATDRSSRTPANIVGNINQKNMNYEKALSCFCSRRSGHYIQRIHANKIYKHGIPFPRCHRMA